ncbi:MAG: glycosyltransferase family 2 protein [Acidobacteria bacterium]|nr:glycosyltransferase family 2 protein [Acidobacteriota bacterium]
MPEPAGSALMPASAGVSVVVLTFNEEKNITACLESVRGWATDVFVVDSGSTDRTVELATASGATVRVHPFETHAGQWTWALAELPLATDWVLGLDADQRVTGSLQDAMRRAMTSGAAADVAGFYVNRRQIFRGRWIRHGGYYPKYLLKLFRRDAVSVNERDLVDHHFSVAGRVGTLDGDLIEDNRNEADIQVWIDKHNRYARLQARQELADRRRTGGGGVARLFGSPDERVRWMKARWNGMPLFVRPGLYFIYRYVLRLGFLDGREGFLFHVLQAFWYRLLVDINISELRQNGETADLPGRQGGPAARIP